MQLIALSKPGANFFSKEWFENKEKEESV